MSHRRTATVAVGLLAAVIIPTAAVSAQPDAAQAVTTAIAAGDGATAARIIADNGLASQPTVLGRIIYNAGVLAVTADNGSVYGHAVAVAFVSGGASLLTANRAFGTAATLVLVNAPHDTQLVAELGPGGDAVAQTELAYVQKH